jgi:hypothetical protein
MAGGEKERRMLFDLRGRRRNVVKVVYAVLAVLMGLSLFIIGGSGSISGIFGDGASGGGELAELAEERAERVEAKLAKNPEDPNLLLNLTRARIQAGEASSGVNPETGEPVVSLQTRQEYEKASEAWSQYVSATDEPSATAAQQVARALFTLAQISRTPAEIEANMQAAADAQQIAVEKRPTASALSNYALYKTFAFDYAEAEQAAERAKKLATNKFERENFENELEQSTQSAKQFEKQLARAKKQTQGGGKEQLEAPVPGFGGATLGE